MTTDRLLGMVPGAPEGQGGPPEGQGRLVGRRYRLLSPVGRGGMGMVWHAHDVLLDRDVAVKELLLPFGLDHAGRQIAHTRVLREARSAARLSHPGIVTVHDVVEEDGRPWIVMELVRAWSLEQAVRQSGPLPVPQAAEIGIRVLDALRHAHAAGILHRDVKPGNVLLTADRVVLTDFGIAAIEGDVTITHPGLLMGSPAYIPPERLQGRPITHAADLWSFGATLYAAVEGRPPYEGPDAVAVLGAVLTQEPSRPSRAGALLPVIDGLLRKNPADRIGAPQVAEMLERVLNGHVAHGSGHPQAAPPRPAQPAAGRALPPLDLPPGPLPSRIIETPSGPVRVPYDPLTSPSGSYGAASYLPNPGSPTERTQIPPPPPTTSGSYFTPRTPTGSNPLPSPPVNPYDTLSSPSGSTYASDRLSGGTMWPTPGAPDPAGSTGQSAYESFFGTGLTRGPVNDAGLTRGPVRDGGLTQGPAQGADPFGGAGPGRAGDPFATGGSGRESGRDSLFTTGRNDFFSADGFGRSTGPDDAVGSGRMTGDPFSTGGFGRSTGQDNAAGSGRTTGDPFTAGSFGRSTGQDNAAGSGQSAGDPFTAGSFGRSTGDPFPAGGFGRSTGPDDAGGSGRSTGDPFPAGSFGRSTGDSFTAGGSRAGNPFFGGAAGGPFSAGGSAGAAGDPFSAGGSAGAAGDPFSAGERNSSSRLTNAVTKGDVPSRTGARRRAHDDGGGAGRGGAMAVIASVAVIAVVVLVLLIMIPDSGDNAGTGAKQLGTSGSPAAQPTGKATEPGVPEGYQTRAAGGVSVAVPKDWKVAEAEGDVRLTGPRDTGQSVTIKQVPSGTLSALQEAEKKAAGFEEYTQVTLATVPDYHFPAAEWEYTYRDKSKVTVHTATRFIVAGGQSYSVTFTAPDYDWTESAAPVREALWETFSPE